MMRSMFVGLATMLLWSLSITSSTLGLVAIKEWHWPFWKALIIGGPGWLHLGCMMLAVFLLFAWAIGQDCGY